MKEYNNRQKANKFAEYITGQELRKYLAKKVERYCGKNATVFDGAAGSGQLEEHIKPAELCAVEIQPEPCELLEENFEKVEVNNISFFNYDNPKYFQKFDAVVMNPPFSLKFKDLSEEEKENIQEEFPWKKSGVVDDIFILKSLEYTKRYAFYIMFPGIAYRKTEIKMRELIGKRLKELNVIQNAFEDTNINVLFLVIDKEKTTDVLHNEIYDCKTKQIKFEEYGRIDPDFYWNIPSEPKIEEEIDIDAINLELEEITLNHIKNHLESQMVLIRQFNADIDLMRFISKAYDILNDYELRLNFGAE